MSNLECSVCIGSDAGNAVFLSDDDDFAVLALIADTLVIKVLDLFHDMYLHFGNYKFHSIQKK